VDFQVTPMRSVIGSLVSWSRSLPSVQIIVGQRMSVLWKVRLGANDAGEDCPGKQGGRGGGASSVHERVQAPDSRLTVKLLSRVLTGVRMNLDCCSLLEPDSVETTK